MSMKYNYLHSAGEGEQDRYLVCEKRLSEAWHMYTLIEQMQRYMISGPVSRGDTIELSLKHYLPLLNLEFSKKWSRHQCSKPGCGTCIIFDGGMKGIGVKITETEVTFLQHSDEYVQLGKVVFEYFLHPNLVLPLVR